MTLRPTPERTMKNSQATVPTVSLVTDNAKLGGVRPIRGHRPAFGCTLVLQPSHAVRGNPGGSFHLSFI
jgi:hypothetical protein